VRRFSSFCLLAGMFVLALQHPHFGWAEIVNRVVAQVNSEVITLFELNKKMKEITGLEATELRRKDEETFFKIRRQILDLLVDEKITNEKIREFGIRVTSREVDAAIEKIKESNQLTHEDLLDSLKKNAMSYEDYRRKVKNDLERSALINYEVKLKIVIREEEISKYYNDHMDEFSTPERVRLAAIFLKQEDPSDQDESRVLYRKAEEIVSGLKSGADFGDMARRFSQGPAAKEGGDLGVFETFQLDPELTRIIKDLSPGDVSRPILRPSGIQIIKLIEKKSGVVKPIEEVRDAIYKILYDNEINKRYSTWIKELREKAYLKIIF